MIQKLGNAVKQKLEHLSYGIGYFGKVLVSSVTFFTKGKTSHKIFVMQLYFTYVQALPLICMLGIILGSVLYIAGYPFLLSIGQASLTFDFLVLIIIRELGPVLVAFIVIARSANAIATEIGGMVADHEIESYISFGIDPIAHLVAPRFLGVTVSVFLLTLYFSFSGILAPVFLSQLFNPVSFSEYFSGLLQATSIETLLVSGIKGFVFGMVISICSTYYGFTVMRASTEVPVVGIKAVGKSLLFVSIADVVITAISYL